MILCIRLKKIDSEDALGKPTVKNSISLGLMAIYIHIQIHIHIYIYIHMHLHYVKVKSYSYITTYIYIHTCVLLIHHSLPNNNRRTTGFPMFHLTIRQPAGTSRHCPFALGQHQNSGASPSSASCHLWLPRQLRCWPYLCFAPNNNIVCSNVMQCNALKGK